MSDSVWPQRWQPTRLPHPWDSPGKDTGVGCHFLLQCMKVKSESEVVQSCPTLSDPMDCSLPGSSIHGIFQARVLEWGAIAFSLPVSTHHFLKSFNLFFYGCAGSCCFSSFSLVVRHRQWLLLLQSMGSALRWVGFSNCGSQALERRLNSCGSLV